jgi:predicted protein tyrosine phosphatase
MSKISTYTKGGISGLTFDKDKDVIISVSDFANKPIITQKDVRALHLNFDDINDNSLSKKEIFVGNRLRTEYMINKFLFIFNEGWPVLPFTPFHAKNIIDFVIATPDAFNKNWHINCEYGRSRSVSVAIFLSQMFPNNEVVLARDVSRPNTRVLRILNKEWGIL